MAVAQRKPTRSNRLARNAVVVPIDGIGVCAFAPQRFLPLRIEGSREDVNGLFCNGLATVPGAAVDMLRQHGLLRSAASPSLPREASTKQATGIVLCQAAQRELRCLEKELPAIARRLENEPDAPRKLVCALVYQADKADLSFADACACARGAMLSSFDKSSFSIALHGQCPLEVVKRECRALASLVKPSFRYAVVCPEKSEHDEIVSILQPMIAVGFCPNIVLELTRHTIGAIPEVVRLLLEQFKEDFTFDVMLKASAESAPTPASVTRLVKELERIDGGEQLQHGRVLQLVRHCREAHGRSVVPPVNELLYCSPSLREIYDTNEAALPYPPRTPAFLAAPWHRVFAAAGRVETYPDAQNNGRGRKLAYLLDKYRLERALEYSTRLAEDVIEPEVKESRFEVVNGEVMLAGGKDPETEQDTLQQKSAAVVYSTRFQRELTFPATWPNLDQMRITTLDCDFTENCNLRCSYCFKDKNVRRAMSMDTAREMVRWLARHSGNASELHITIMGGEPLLAMDMMKEWTPFAVTYCEQRGKKLSVGITTNLTLFTRDLIPFFRKWHIGMHTSIDGTPEVQDANRILADGAGSSGLVEANLENLFNAWRTSHARATIVPETVDRLYDSFRYFLDKGFLKVALEVAESDGWSDPEKITILGEQAGRMLEHLVLRIQQDGRYYCLTMLERYFERENKERQNVHCGAGRGMLHVDVEGFLWPCHRFNGKAPQENWIIGHIRGGFHPARRNAFLNINPKHDIKAPCAECVAEVYCGCPCIAAGWQENGDLFKPSEGYCAAQRALYLTIDAYIKELTESAPDVVKQLRDWAENYTW